MAKSFAERFSENLGKSQKPEFRKAYNALENVARGIRDTLRSPGSQHNLDVELEPGYITNLGQQFRLRLSIPTRKWQDTLLRAYIPTDGFPVRLDLGEEEPVTCADQGEIERAVLGFLTRPEIDGRLTIVRDLL